MSPTPDISPDVYIPLGSLAIKIIGIGFGLLITAHIAITKRAFSKIDKLEKGLVDCNEKHPSKEYMELQKEFLESRFKHIESGQKSIHDRLDDFIPRRKTRRDE